jgi:hypothetical protein
LNWAPDPAWEQVRGAHGPNTVGIWRFRDRIFKRLHPGLNEWPATHVGYWRREADLAHNPWMLDGPGLVPVDFHGVEEDSEGITIESQYVTGEPPTTLMVTRALGSFAKAPFRETPWCTRSLLETRLSIVQSRGGWLAMERTSIADICQRLWLARHDIVERTSRGPQGRMHGDATPKNFLTTRGDDVVAIDWQCFGIGPIGTDLGYWALSAKEDFDVLSEIYSGDHEAQEEIILAARTMMAYTLISRADLALVQANRLGVGLAALQKHPSVAPHLRAIQRHLPQIEALLS